MRMYPVPWLSESIKRVTVKCSELLKEAVKTRKAGSTSAAILRNGGLRSAKLIISDKSLGILEALGDFFPEAHWQRCAVHFYRNVLSAVPASRFRKVAVMLKAIHDQEDGRQRG